MPLSPGDKLGHYQVISLLGVGGMGEVYKARDTRLDRTVAVKVLPEHIAKREDLRARFEREARAVASLKHPNICVLHDIGSQDGAGYMVMELLEGETLASRIEKGALPLDQVLKLATQIADALDRAHRAGVTHRDVKPQNIMLTRDGVKVLDFGLAKSAPKPGPTEATLTAVLTTEGTMMGTPQYMAPEQFEGKEADARSDIWAFGAVLYEMATGQKAFQGKSYSSLLGAILSADPPPMSVKPFTPAWLERLVRRCLQKDPEDRWQSMRDVVIELQTPPQEVEITAPSRSRLGWVACAVAGVMTLALGISLWALWRATQPVDRPLVRLDVDLGPDVSLPTPSPGGSQIAISPDGTRLAYVSGTPTKLFVRRLDQGKATELPGTQGAVATFFSPDGQSIGFYSPGTLKKISVEGGAVVALGNFGGGGTSWGEDGSIVVGVPFTKGLLRIPAGGGPPETVAELGSGEQALSQPQILPGGKAILFSVGRPDPGARTIEVLTLADRRRKIVARGGTSPRYLPTSRGLGHLIYLTRSTLFAVPFDLDKLETRGTPVPFLEDVAYQVGRGAGQFDFAGAPLGHGTFIYRRAGGGESVLSMLQWVDPTGKREPLGGNPGAYGPPSLSPDGKRVALTVREGENQDIWVYDQQRDAMTRLTFGENIYISPVWSPDGQTVVFASAGRGIFQARADGAGQPQALVQSETVRVPSSFMPDGKRLAYLDGGLVIRIWTVPLEGHGGELKPGTPEQFLKSSFTELAPSFSPDGRWLAYDSSESGRPEVYVRPFPQPSSGQSGKWQISNSGGVFPHWSRSEHKLMYQSSGQIMAASYSVRGDTFVAEKPRVWIAKLGGPPAGIAPTWDLAPDGKRVLMLMPMDSGEAPKQEHEVVFLQNFFDELRRRVPTGK